MNIRLKVHCKENGQHSALPFSLSFWPRSGWPTKATRKYKEWQADRAYAFQEEVLKQPPLTVMVCKIGFRDYSIEKMAKLRVVSRQPVKRTDDEKWDLMVLAPSKDEKDVQWLTCQIEARYDSFRDDCIKPGVRIAVRNFCACTRVCCLFEGPDAWAKARPIGNLPEKPWHWYGKSLLGPFHS